ncbi:pleckstrin homology domain-containing family G member 4B-like [Lytechinus pictus]|uniref:pleckstrin homology domain-containing family G member 4B-like n=1 Tax=Lytechinus pictus TaxID=7653 RepID=UPI0030BA005E
MTTGKLQSGKSESDMLQLKHKPREPSWPITHSNQILVHLSQLDWDQFHVGDFYVYVRYLGPKKVTLVLVACPETEGTLTEVPIPMEMFREFFSYHAPQRLLLGELKTKDTEDVTGLKTIVVATDTGIMRHLWPDVLKPQFELKRRSSWRKKKRKGEGGVTSGAITDTGTDQETKMPTRMASFSRTSSESKKKPLPPFRAPQSTLEVNFEVLHSEAINLTGSRDQGGRAVLEIKANNHVWCNPDVTLDDIVKLLAYVYSIPREEVRWRGLSIAVDARTAPKSDVERVTEALQLLHEHHPGAIDHVYLLIGHNSVLARVTRATNTQLLKTRLDYKMDLVRSVDKLYQHIPKEQLTSTFSGTFKYTHEDWIRFRMRLEPFICGCKSAAKFLLTSVDELSRGSTKAPSEELRDTIDRLKVKHEEVYKDSRMASLHKEGDFILETLKKEEGALRQTEDFRLVELSLSSSFLLTFSKTGRSLE